MSIFFSLQVRSSMRFSNGKTFILQYLSPLPCIWHFLYREPYPSRRKNGQQVGHCLPSRQEYRWGGMVLDYGRSWPAIGNHGVHHLTGDSISLVTALKHSQMDKSGRGQVGSRLVRATRSSLSSCHVAYT